MRLLRILGKILLGLIILLIVLFGAIYLMKDRIIAKTIEHVEESYEVDIDYEDIDLSIFRSFPNIGIDLDRIKLKNRQDSLSIAEINEVDIDFDIISILKPSGAMKIKGVHLNKPIILYEIYEDGATNIDAFLGSEDTTTTSESQSLLIDINSYSIKEGKIVYYDYSSGTHINLTGLDHSGKGNLSDEIFTLTSSTKLDSFSAEISNEVYASNLQIALDADIEVNSAENLYQFDDVSFSVNELKSKLSGQVQLLEDKINTDIVLENANSGLAELMSIVPSSFQGDISSIDASGNLNLSGIIKGDYIFDEDHYPAVNLILNVDNGQVQYPDLPEKLSQIFVDAKIEKEEGELNLLKVNVNPFSLAIGNNSKMSGQVRLNNIFQNLFAVGMVKGDIDLNEITNAYPIENLKNMSGDAEFEIDFDIAMEDVEQEKYENIMFDGYMSLNNALINYDEYPQIKINAAKADINPQEIKIAPLQFNMGRSDLDGNLSIIKPLNFLSDNKEIKIIFNGKSDFLDYNDFASQSENSSVENEAPQAVSTSEDDADFLNRINVEASYRAGELVYPPYTLENLNAGIKLNSGALVIENTQFVYQKNEISINGNVSGIDQFLYLDKSLNGNLSIASPEFNLYEFMEQGAQEQTNDENATAEDFVLPNNMNIQLNAAVGSLLYDNIILNNLKAKIDLTENQEVFIRESSASTMGGNMSLDGRFEAKDNSKPFYDFNYKLNKLNIPQAVRDVALVEKLAPVTKYMEGFLNSTVKLSGNLNEDLGLDLTSLSLQGFFETINARLNNFEPLNAIGEKLNIKELKNVKIKDSKNWLEVANGNVVVKPFDISLGQLDGTISGRHTLSDNNINYTFETVIPREWLSSNQVTQSVDRGLKWLENEAGKTGLDLNAGDQFFVDFIITGTITKPQVNMKLKDVTGKSIAEATKDRINEERKKVEDSIRTAINNEKKELREKAQARADSIKRAAEEEAKRRAKDILTGKKSDSPSETKKEIDKAAEEAKKKLEETRKKLKKINPFGNR